jgi:hypothetical protein
MNKHTEFQRECDEWLIACGLALALAAGAVAIILI